MNFPSSIPWFPTDQKWWHGKINLQPCPFPSVRSSVIRKGFVLLWLTLWTQANQLKKPQECSRGSLQPWKGLALASIPPAQDAASFPTARHKWGDRPVPLPGKSCGGVTGWRWLIPLSSGAASQGRPSQGLSPVHQSHRSLSTAPEHWQTGGKGMGMDSRSWSHGC